MLFFKFYSIIQLLLIFVLFSCENFEIPPQVDSISFTQIGILQNRSTKEIISSTWSIGGETLDRGYAVYDHYKEYLEGLGAKRIRFQTGWAKIEKNPGVYEWDWLDNIIHDALSRSIQPWLQLSYGNPIYPGGGIRSLGSPLPSSAEALEAWDNWVGELVERYKGDINEWEIWNEPDHDNSNPLEYAAFFIRTAKIIRKIQPTAKIYAIASATLDRNYFYGFLDNLKDNLSLHLVTAITYHGYTVIPESHYPTVQELKNVVRYFSNEIYLFQGENGAPSKKGSYGALSEADWNEISQAKWNLRRMISDYGRNIPTNIFSIIDMEYPKGWNYKGILKADNDKKVDKPKIAYNAMKNVTSIFDQNIIVDTKSNITHNYRYSLSKYSFIDNRNNSKMITFWYDGEKPNNSNLYKLTDISVSELKLTQPVLVNLLDGKIYEIPMENWICEDTNCKFFEIPVLDSPLIITDKESILFKQ
jgi:hypothetical protein